VINLSKLVKNWLHFQAKLVQDHREKKRKEIEEERERRNRDPKLKEVIKQTNIEVIIDLNL